MEYLVAYPEDLAAAGSEVGTFDLVFANSSVNVDFCPEEVFREAFRVLPRRGAVHDGVVAAGERDAATVARARGARQRRAGLRPAARSSRP